MIRSEWKIARYRCAIFPAKAESKLVDGQPLQGHNVTLKYPYFVRNSMADMSTRSL